MSTFPFHFYDFQSHETRMLGFEPSVAVHLVLWYLSKLWPSVVFAVTDDLIIDGLQLDVTSIHRVHIDSTARRPSTVNSPMDSSEYAVTEVST